MSARREKHAGREEAAARLIERVLSDAAYRAWFRRDPAAAARELGLDLDEDAAGHPALEALELRESKSSLAGAMVAAAVEGVAAYHVAEHILGGGVPDAEAATPEPARLVTERGQGGEIAGGGESDDAESEVVAADGETDDAGRDEETDGAGDYHNAADEGEDEEEDEDEPDEVGPDIDDLTDDEVIDPEGDGGDDSDDDGRDSDDGADEPDGGGSSDGTGDPSEGTDSNDESTGSGDADGGEGDAPDLGNISSEYPGDDASRAEIALWMGAEAQRRGLPAELPVMAALVESGLKNLPGGDADSVGFFQMRASIWNSGDYAGYADQPELQLDWFLDHAKTVRAQRVAAGLPVDDPDQYGEWIADVERPAEQYRGRYQERLEEARELLRRQRGGAEDLADGAGGAQRAGPRAREAVAEARKYLGTPYLWGGSTPKTGFDCSGLAQWAYAKAGIKIPRVTDQQILAENATKVSRKHLLPGDLVFFRDASGYVHHVGISLGGHRFLHAPRTGDVVKISSLKESYYAEQFTGGRRFDPAVTASSPRTDARLDANAVTRAQAALARDATEVQTPGSALFRAIQVQEEHKLNQAQVLPVIRPDQAKRS